MLRQDLHNLFSRSIGYGLLRYRAGVNRRIHRLYAEMVRTQFESASFFRDRQLDRLRRLLEHARSNVPYYRDLFKQVGFDPRNLKHVNDLQQIPRLTKPIIRERLMDLITDGVSKKDLLQNFTGGSTGTAMEFYQDEQYVAEGGALLDFSDYMAGWRPGTPRARLWGAPRDLAEYRSWRAKLRSWVYNYHQFNAFELSEHQLDLYDKHLSRIRPTILVCYATAAWRLAEVLRNRGQRPRYPLAGVVTSAEMLPAHMRRVIEDVFPVRVFDRYACREVGCLASECEAHHGLHVHMLVNLVEVDTAPGNDEGDVLVTNLSNYAMPFIRYEIGDRATRRHGRCACGRETQMIQSVTGRVTDFFLTRDGNYIAGPSLTLLFYGVSSIDKYQFIQSDYDRYELRIVPTSRWDPVEIERLLARIRLYLGDAAVIQVVRVESIPPTEAGKLRFIICNIPRSGAPGPA